MARSRAAFVATRIGAIGAPRLSRWKSRRFHEYSRSCQRSPLWKASAPTLNSMATMPASVRSTQSRRLRRPAISYSSRMLQSVATGLEQTAARNTVCKQGHCASHASCWSGFNSKPSAAAPPVSFSIPDSIGVSKNSATVARKNADIAVTSQSRAAIPPKRRGLLRELSVRSRERCAFPIQFSRLPPGQSSRRALRVVPRVRLV